MRQPPVALVVLLVLASACGPGATSGTDPSSGGAQDASTLDAGPAARDARPTPLASDAWLDAANGSAEANGPEDAAHATDATDTADVGSVSADAAIDVVTGSQTDGGQPVVRDAAAGAGSVGCGVSTAVPLDSVQQTMQIAGTTRYYLLHIPAGYSPTVPMPLIFAFHGLNGNDVWVSQGGDWYGTFGLQAATAGKAIVVFPQGSGSPPGTTIKLNGSSTWNDNAADLGFFDALLADLEAKYCVATARVFATGYSMGGAFTNTLGCKRASVLRAIVPIEGWGPGSAPTSGTPSCPAAMGQVAAMVFHGTNDRTIPYRIGQSTADFWRTASGCTATTAPSTAYPSCVAYQGCRAGRDVAFCTHSGDHQVPANAGATMWKFFSDLP